MGALARRFVGTLIGGALVVALAACGGNDPRCAPGSSSYRICSANAVWECPVGTPEQLAAREAVDALCAMEEDPIPCLLRESRKLSTVPMDQITKCSGGTMCVDDPFTDAAGCE